MSEILDIKIPKILLYVIRTSIPVAPVLRISRLLSRVIINKDLFGDHVVEKGTSKFKV